MINENEIKSPNVDVVNSQIDTSEDYIAAIAEMKKNSVSKEEYEKLRQENKNLLQTLVEGGTIAAPQTKPEVDVDKLRQELFGSDNCDLTNLQYITKSLELRDALIERGEPDCYLPISSRYSPTLEEVNQANNVAEVFRECIEYANGDSQIFTQELMRRTADTMPNRRSR